MRSNEVKAEARKVFREFIVPSIWDPQIARSKIEIPFRPYEDDCRINTGLIYDRLIPAGLFAKYDAANNAFPIPRENNGVINNEPDTPRLHSVVYLLADGLYEKYRRHEELFIQDYPRLVGMDWRTRTMKFFNTGFGMTLLAGIFGLIVASIGIGGVWFNYYLENSSSAEQTNLQLEIAVCEKGPTIECAEAVFGVK